MSARRLVVVGASSGGIDVIRAIAAELPADFPAAVCIVVHTSPEGPSVLDRIIGRASPLPVAMGAEGTRLEPGHIYVAPPDRHLVVEPGILRLTKGPKENRFRPAIDPLFRSAAQVFGPAAIGVILSGELDDGAAGLRIVKQLGGVAIVQDPGDAPFPSMPQSALRHVPVDYCVRAREIAPLLARIVETPADAPRAISVPEEVEVAVRISKGENALQAGVARIGSPSLFTCPDCHGVLLQLNEANPVRFRCHTGHAYSGQSLVAAVSAGIEDTLWSAVRALEEGMLLMRQMGEQIGAEGDAAGAERLEARARDIGRQLDALRQLATTRAE